MIPIGLRIMLIRFWDHMFHNPTMKPTLIYFMVGFDTAFLVPITKNLNILYSIVFFQQGSNNSLLTCLACWIKILKELNQNFDVMEKLVYLQFSFSSKVERISWIFIFFIYSPIKGMNLVCKQVRSKFRVINYILKALEHKGRKSNGKRGREKENEWGNKTRNFWGK